MLKNTKAQADSVRETSASVEQMVVSIRRVDEHVKTLLEISTRSRQEVQGGIATVEKANQGLDRINQSITASAENIRVLDERAENIGKIIEVIDDISEQTNLLALNAAIEAARAGEHGLGFSVVADEVRKLAEKSAQSTREISDLIQSIQKEARNAVHSMQQNAGIVSQGIELGSELTRSLSQIAHVVSEVDRFATEIGAATGEQSAGSSQIALATSRLNEITHEISSAAEEQTTGTQTVVKTMERLRDVVNKSSSSASELAAAAEQMARMSRQTLKVTEQFRLLEHDTVAPARAESKEFHKPRAGAFSHEYEAQLA
jgi:methyl-accepting chemotaxis protein